MTRFSDREYDDMMDISPHSGHMRREDRTSRGGVSIVGAVTRGDRGGDRPDRVDRGGGDRVGGDRGGGDRGGGDPRSRGERGSRGGVSSGRMGDRENSSRSTGDCRSGGADGFGGGGGGYGRGNNGSGNNFGGGGGGMGNLSSCDRNLAISGGGGGRTASFGRSSLEAGFTQVPERAGGFAEGSEGGRDRGQCRVYDYYFSSEGRAGVSSCFSSYSAGQHSQKQQFYGHNEQFIVPYGDKISGRNNNGGRHDDFDNGKHGNMNNAYGNTTRMQQQQNTGIPPPPPGHPPQNSDADYPASHPGCRTNNSSNEQKYPIECGNLLNSSSNYQSHYSPMGRIPPSGTPNIHYPKKQSYYHRGGGGSGRYDQKCQWTSNYHRSTGSANRRSRSRSNVQRSRSSPRYSPVSSIGRRSRSRSKVRRSRSKSNSVRRKAPRRSPSYGPSCNSKSHHSSPSAASSSRRGCSDYRHDSSNDDESEIEANNNTSTGKVAHLGAHFDALEAQTVEVVFVKPRGNNNSSSYNDKKAEHNLKDFRPVANMQEAREVLHEDVINNLKKNGFERLTPIQRYAFRGVAERNNVMASAQTGCGKTLAFLCPVVSNILNDDPVFRPFFPGKNAVASPLALVLCPTRELALQIDEQVAMLISDTVLHHGVVYGGETAAEQVAEISKKQPDIMTATPGRLLDLVDACKVSLTFVKFLTLDEADVMLSMGFDKQIEALVLGRDMPDCEQLQTLLFSATFPSSMKGIIDAVLKPPYLRITVGSTGVAAAVIKQVVKFVENRNKVWALINDLKSTSGKTIVFVAKRSSVYSILGQLKKEGFFAEPLHGKMDQVVRHDVYNSFRENKFRVLVATSIVARGLDFPDVAVVINFDMPSSFDQYAHRIGRTGRIGHEGLAISYFNYDDRNLANQLVGHLQKTYQNIPEWLMRMAQQYTMGSQRRRQ